MRSHTDRVGLLPYLHNRPVFVKPLCQKFCYLSDSHCVVFHGQGSSRPGRTPLFLMMTLGCVSGQNTLSIISVFPALLMTFVPPPPPPMLRLCGTDYPFPFRTDSPSSSSSRTHSGRAGRISGHCGIRQRRRSSEAAARVTVSALESLLCGCAGPPVLASGTGTLDRDHAAELVHAFPCLELIYDALNNRSQMARGLRTSRPLLSPPRWPRHPPPLPLSQRPPPLYPPLLRRPISPRVRLSRSGSLHPLPLPPPPPRCRLHRRRRYPGRRLSSVRSAHLVSARGLQLPLLRPPGEPLQRTPTSNG